jgi:lipopolysaccharide/colanic/teichoic acid biosynthesis glycosyltransferase
MNFMLKENISVKERGSKKAILFIGDNQSIISGTLAHEYECLSFRDAFQALPWINYNSINTTMSVEAIVCDLQFPGGDAYSLFDYVRGLKSLKNIPFIVVSQFADKAERAKAHEKGFDDFYTFPVNSYDLYNRIKFLQQFKKNKEILIKEQSVPKTETSFIKRFIDIVVSAISLIILSPLFLAIAVLIKLDSKGPVFYISKRAAKGYKIINFYKFRTMFKDADQELNQVMHLNSYPDNSSFIKIKNDPRITKVGRWLRNTSIDELPQLINVFIGDMSLVGNRPLPLYEAEKLTKDQLAKRFLAPAGITGLWQISKRSNDQLSESDRIQLDITYADKNSTVEDLKILMRTFPAVVQKESL